MVCVVFLYIVVTYVVYLGPARFCMCACDSPFFATHFDYKIDINEQNEPDCTYRVIEKILSIFITRTFNFISVHRDMDFLLSLKMVRVDENSFGKLYQPFSCIFAALHKFCQKINKLKMF